MGVILGVFVGFILYLVLQFIPIIGPLIAGIVAGILAKGTGSGALAGFLSSIIGVLLVSMFFAGIGGATLVHYRSTVSPGFYDIPLMLLIILAAVVGGSGTIIGPIIGGLIVYLTKHWWLKGALSTLTTSGLPINDDIILYTILIVIAILVPEGLWTKIRKFVSKT